MAWTKMAWMGKVSAADGRRLVRPRRTENTCVRFCFGEHWVFRFGVTGDVVLNDSRFSHVKVV